MEKEIQEGLEKLKNLGDLPAEMLLDIFSMVAPKDVLAVSETCSRFKKIIKLHGDRLWAKVCRNYYQIDIHQPMVMPNDFTRMFSYTMEIFSDFGHKTGARKIPGRISVKTAQEDGRHTRRFYGNEV